LSYWLFKPKFFSEFPRPPKKILAIVQCLGLEAQKKTEKILPTDFKISSWVIFNTQLHLSKEIQKKEYNVSNWV